MIAIDMEMPSMCTKCPCGAGRGINIRSDVYDAVCYKPKAKGEAPVIYRDIPRGTRPPWCPLIDLSKYEDDLR